MIANSDASSPDLASAIAAIAKPTASSDAEISPEPSSIAAPGNTSATPSGAVPIEASDDVPPIAGALSAFDITTPAVAPETPAELDVSGASDIPTEFDVSETSDPPTELDVSETSEVSMTGDEFEASGSPVTADVPGTSAASVTGDGFEAPESVVTARASVAPDEPLGPFHSSTTPGFSGELLDDSTVRVVWQAEPGAAGYNVYRHNRYVSTVHEPEYIDTNVFDRDYYYEIHAFNASTPQRFTSIATGLTVRVRGLGRTDPDQEQPDENLLDGYELVFADEFDLGVLDHSKWNTRFLWGPDLVINNEDQYYVDVRNDPDFGFDPFTFENDTLVINAVPTPPELRHKAKDQPYLSGIITSYDAFKFTYGYVEIRARVPYGQGYWPAFWLLNAYYVDDEPEIDIMEFLGKDEDVVYHTYHYYEADGTLRSTRSNPTAGMDFTADFHTYSVDWRPGSIIFYVNRIEVHRIDDPKVSRQDMYVIANLAMGGGWAGAPDETTPFPGRYEIDYIRVYQQTSPYETAPLDDGNTELAAPTGYGPDTSPSHRPNFEQWPSAYPGRQR